MPALQRRRLLGALGALAAAGTGAGCIGESPTGGDGGSSDGPIRADAVVDYPGIVDGEASVSGDGTEISYQDPERSFTFQYAFEGDTDAPDQLHVGRDLSGETMAAYVAPVYDETAGAFAYHVFANEAFVSHADWYYVAGPSTAPVDTWAADFESLTDAVSRHVIGPVDAGTAGVVDFPPSEADAQSGDATGVIVTDGTDRGGGSGSRAPQVAWGFEYDADTGSLAITHEGGDAVSAANLVVVVTAHDRTVHDPFEGEVRAGTEVGVSAPSDATVQIVWGTGDGSERSVLGEWSGPDA